MTFLHGKVTNNLHIICVFSSFICESDLIGGFCIFNKSENLVVLIFLNTNNQANLLMLLKVMFINILPNSNTANIKEKFKQGNSNTKTSNTLSQEAIWP